MSYGQDKDLESRFSNDRMKFKVARVKLMTERVSQYWKRPCIKDSSEIRFKYEFNKNGDLTRIDEFHRGHYYKTINYARNVKGDFTQKTYVFYDSVDNIKWMDPWFLKFDKKGRKVLEVWVRNTDTIRVNKLSYDKRGNYIEQFTDGWLKWRFKYDRKNRLIESDECRLAGDSMQCHSLTKYFFENDLMTRKVIYSKADEIWKEFDYGYDRTQRLVKSVEKHHTLVRYNDDPWKKEIRVTTTVFENDQDGNCIVKSEFTGEEKDPFRCTYYDYEYY